MICAISGAKMLVLAASAFTLSWTHSVEKIEWLEHWRVEDGALKIVSARVEGSGAGMDPPEGSVLEDGGWNYVPKLPKLPALHLAASGATVSGWTLCPERDGQVARAGDCLTLGRTSGPAITIRPCDEKPSDRG